MSDHDHNFEMVLKFDTDDESFVRGFEAGRIWEILKSDPKKLPGQLFHSSNVEMVMRMIEQTGVSLTAKFTDDERWMVLE